MRRVRYRLTSEPLFVHCCHCLNCQRQTGSAFVINALIEADRVELLSGDPEPVAVPRGGGKKQKIWRCPTCQVALFSQYTSARVRFCAPARSTTCPRRVGCRHLHLVVEAPPGSSSRKGAPALTGPTTTRTSCGRP